MKTIFKTKTSAPIEFTVGAILPSAKFPGYFDYFPYNPARGINNKHIIQGIVRRMDSVTLPTHEIVPLYSTRITVTMGMDDKPVAELVSRQGTISGLAVHAIKQRRIR